MESNNDLFDQLAGLLDRLILNFMPYKPLAERTDIATNLLRAVRGVPPDVLEPAVDFIIANDSFIPNGKRLLDVIRQVNPTPSLASPLWGVFAAECNNIRTAIDPDTGDWMYMNNADAWASLADRAKAAGMPEMAAAFQSRADYLADIAAAFGAGNGDASQAENRPG